MLKGYLEATFRDPASAVGNARASRVINHPLIMISYCKANGSSLFGRLSHESTNY